MGDAARLGIGFVPFVGSGLDIDEGARDGNWVQFGFGIGGMAIDIATMGAGSLVKGSIKTIGTRLVEEGVEKAAKEAAETGTEEGIKMLSRTEMAGVWGKGADNAYRYNDYNQARNAALKWLDTQGFKAEQDVFENLELRKEK